MDIPANQIVHHIEAQLASLRKGLANGEERTVAECATVIEAYCQLLKGASKQERMTNKRDTTEYQRFSPKQLHTPSKAEEDRADKGGNLLDF